MALRGIFLLGFCGLTAAVKRPFRARRSLDRARARHAAERIASLDPEALAAHRTAAGCLGCGRCDTLAPGRADLSPADWILSGTRDLTDVDLAAGFPHDEETLARLESACPAGVPFRALAAAARRMAAALT